MNAKEIEKKILEKREFTAHADGSFYKLPSYKVIIGKGLERTARTIDLPIVRGSRIGKDGKEFMSIQGTTIETLLAVCQHDLEEKHKLLPNHDTQEAIYHIQKALDNLENRQRDRFKRKVIATNEK
jgi:hypothetical protein